MRRCHLLVIKPRRLRLAQVIARKPHHPPRSRQAGPNRGLEQPLQVECDVVVLPAEKRRRPEVARGTSAESWLPRPAVIARRPLGSADDDALPQAVDERQDWL